MARVVGTILSAGSGVANLLVKAFEEIKTGYDPENGQPCRFGSPVSSQVGQDSTDAAGNFSISYVPGERPDDECGYRVTVYVAVFDGATLVWRSPRKTPGATTTRFDHDILPDQPPDDGPARIFGTLTRCGQPAAGHRIVAFEEVKTGVLVPPRPCRMTAPRTRHLGSVVVDPQGKFEIKYTPTPEPDNEDLCAFVQNVRVGAFDGAVEVWRSPNRPFAPTVRFDHELYPGCSGDSTLVRVVDEAGRRLAGAEVFADGTSRGFTDGVGQLFVTGLHAGSVLVARLRVLEHETTRESHDDHSDRNWNYRVYITSATLSHDANGDQPRFEMVTVANPAAPQDLVVRRRNTIIGFNLIVSVEWDATDRQLLIYRDRMLETSELLFNGTDGQFLIEYVSVRDNGTSWHEADYRVAADWDQGSNTSSLGAINGSSGVVTMNPYNMLFPGVMLHEFGHYGFDLEDEYEAADCWPDGAKVYCTLRSVETGTPFSEGAGKDSCFMRGAETTPRKKLCSAHPANPHVACTSQGDQDCWSVVAERYGGHPEWRLLTPVSRSAIVDRLPDRGPNPVSAVNYIPVDAWKPRWHVRLVTRPGECPDLIVRVTRNGAPLDNARVTLQTSDGRSLLQGRTAARHQPDGVVTGPGEIATRGAHIGDKVNASVQIGLVWVGRTVPLTSCASPLVIDLSLPGVPAGMRAELTGAGVGLTVRPYEGVPLAPPTISVLHEGEVEPFVIDASRLRRGLASELIMSADEDRNTDLLAAVFDGGGNAILMRSRVAQRQLVVDGRRRLVSATGELAIVLPRGAVQCPARVLMDEAIDVPPPPLETGDTLLVGAQRVTCSRGDALRAPAWLHLGAAGDSAGPGTAAPAIELLSYDAAGGAWRRVTARIHLRPLVASASITHLGVFALVRRRGH